MADRRAGCAGRNSARNHAERKESMLRVALRTKEKTTTFVGVLRMRGTSLCVALLFLLSPGVEGAGFDEYYEMRVGQFDGDGLPDVYVSSSRGTVIVAVDDLPIVIPPPVAPFVLRNNGDGSFSLVTSPLSAEQRRSMSTWPTVAVDFSLRDVDANGAVDLTLEDLETSFGAFDHIVFAHHQRGRGPIQVTPKDDKFRRYHDDLARWMLDPGYFSNVPLKVVSAQPTTSMWYGFVSDARAYSTVFQLIADCKSTYPSYVCGYTSTDPVDCTQSVIVLDENMQPVGVDPNHEVCQYSVHVYVYLPGSVTVVADTSIYDTDAKETAELIRRLRENCPQVPILDPEAAHGVEQILSRVYGANIFDQSVGPVNVDNSISHPPVAGDGAFTWADPTFHHYDVQTQICTLGSPGCSVGHLNELLRWFSYPSFRLQPTMTRVDSVEHVLVWISTSAVWYHNSYVVPGGTITQRFLNGGYWQGAIQNVTDTTHIVYPGAITRKIRERGNALEVFTHGIGLNRIFCTIYDQSIDRPIQLIMGFSNDVFGAAAFRALDKQMKRRHQSNPTGLPSSSSGQGMQKPGESLPYRVFGGVNSEI